MAYANTVLTISNGLLASQPKNLNFLSPLGFRFVLRRSPNLNFFVTDVNIPSINLGYVELPSPFKIIELPGDKLDFGDLTITFKVDEDLANYLEIFNWVYNLGFPETTQQFANLRNAKNGDAGGIFSDATLSILSSSMKPNAEVVFEDLFPISLSDVNFTTTDTDINYVTATVVFKFKLFKINKL